MKKHDAGRGFEANDLASAIGTSSFGIHGRIDDAAQFDLFDVGFCDFVRLTQTHEAITIHFGFAFLEQAQIRATGTFGTRYVINPQFFQCFIERQDEKNLPQLVDDLQAPYVLGLARDEVHNQPNGYRKGERLPSALHCLHGAFWGRRRRRFSRCTLLGTFGRGFGRLDFHFFPIESNNHGVHLFDARCTQFRHVIAFVQLRLALGQCLLQRFLFLRDF